MTVCFNYRLPLYIAYTFMKTHISTKRKRKLFFISFILSSSLSYFLYLLIPRNLGPNRKKTHGKGVNARAINPSKLLAQWIPRASNTIYHF